MRGLDGAIEACLKKVHGEVDTVGIESLDQSEGFDMELDLDRLLLDPALYC